jgi:hypothetical protein
MLRACGITCRICGGALKAFAAADAQELQEIRTGKHEGTVRADFNREMFFHFHRRHQRYQSRSPDQCFLFHARSAGRLIDIFMNGALTAAGRKQYQTLAAANVSLK